MGENEDSAKKRRADACAVEVLVSGKPGEPEHWQRILWKAFGLGERQVLYFDLRRGNGCESDNEFVLVDGNVGGAEMVAELVLTSETEEEAVEVDLS
jgi:pimeloyl-ACP methyl ester carboxylesterase